MSDSTQNSSLSSESEETVLFFVNPRTGSVSAKLQKGQRAIDVTEPSSVTNLLLLHILRQVYLPPKVMVLSSLPEESLTAGGGKLNG